MIFVFGGLCMYYFLIHLDDTINIVIMFHFTTDNFLKNNEYYVMVYFLIYFVYVHVFTNTFHDLGTYTNWPHMIMVFLLNILYEKNLMSY